MHHAVSWYAACPIHPTAMQAKPTPAEQTSINPYAGRPVSRWTNLAAPALFRLPVLTMSASWNIISCPPFAFSMMKRRQPRQRGQERPRQRGHERTPSPGQTTCPIVPPICRIMPQPVGKSTRASPWFFIAAFVEWWPIAAPTATICNKSASMTKRVRCLTTLRSIAYAPERRMPMTQRNIRFGISSPRVESYDPVGTDCTAVSFILTARPATSSIKLTSPFRKTRDNSGPPGQPGELTTISEIRGEDRQTSSLGRRRSLLIGVADAVAAATSRRQPAAIVLGEDRANQPSEALGLLVVQIAGQAERVAAGIDKLLQGAGALRGIADHGDAGARPHPGDAGPQMRQQEVAVLAGKLLANSLISTMLAAIRSGRSPQNRCTSECFADISHACREPPPR